MQICMDKSHSVELNASVHSQIIGVTQVCAWPIMVQFATAHHCYPSVVKVMTFVALHNWHFRLCSHVWIIIIIIIIIINRFCNARLINPLGSLGAAVWQPQRTHRLLLNLRQTSRLCTHNERPETMDQKYERIPIFRCRRKPECPEKTYQGGYGIGKPNSHTTWLAALVKGRVWALNQPTSPLE